MESKIQSISSGDGARSSAAPPAAAVSLSPAVASVAATGMFSPAELQAFSQAIAGNPSMSRGAGMGAPPAAAEGQAAVPQVYVNAKQYHCIMRRRAKRAAAAAKNQQLLQRKPFLHESRHQHAQKRLRGPGGRFLNKVELEAMGDRGKDSAAAAATATATATAATTAAISDDDGNAAASPAVRRQPSDAAASGSCVLPKQRSSGDAQEDSSADRGCVVPTKARRASGAPSSEAGDDAEAADASTCEPAADAPVAPATKGPSSTAAASTRRHLTGDDILTKFGLAFRAQDSQGAPLPVLLPAPAK